MEHSERKTKGLFTAIGIMLIVSAVVAASIGAFRPPKALGPDAPTDRFSAGRAWKHLETISRIPHSMGSAEHTRVREYIISELLDIGLTPEVQETLVSERFFWANVKNVMARIPGTASVRPVVLVAHYDTVSADPGAGDDSIGVAALIETIRALRNGPSLRHDVIFLFTDAEEEGSMGALAFVSEHAPALRPGIALNIEGGNNGPSYLIETSAGNGDLLRKFSRYAPNPFSSSFAAWFYHRTSGHRSDLFRFLSTGWSGLNFVIFSDQRHYHSQKDTIKTVNPASLQHHGENALALTRAFGNTEPSEGKTGNAVFFNVFGSLMIRYPASWTIPLAAIGLLLLAMTVAAGIRRKIISPVRIAGTVLLIMVILPCFFALGLGYGGLLDRLHGTLLPAGDPFINPYYSLGGVAASLLLISGLYRLVRRRMGWLNLCAAGPAAFLILSLTAAVFIPETSFLFFWPGLAGLAAFSVALFGQDEKLASIGRTAVFLLCALPALLLISTHLFMLNIGQSFLNLGTHLPAFNFLVVALTAACLIPLPEIFVRLRKNFLPILFGAAIVILTTAGALTTRYDVDHPRHVAIRYELDGDSKQACLTVPDNQRGEWTRSFLPQAKPGDPFINGLSGTFHQLVPAADLPIPSMEVSSDESQGDVRSLTLRIHPSPGCRSTVIDVGDIDVLGAALNGRPLFHKTTVLAKRVHLNILLPPSSLDLEMKIRGGSRPQVTLYEWRDGLPDIPGLTIPPRPKNTVSSGNGDQTLVRKKFIIP